MRWGSHAFASKAGLLVSGLRRAPGRLPEMAARANPVASRWLDLAEGRLRLDRLSRNGVGSTFFP